MKWYFLVVLIYFFLIATDIEYFFMFLLYIGISFGGILVYNLCLVSELFFHFWIVRVFYLVWILDSLSDMCFVVFFLPSLSYLFHFLIVSFEAQILLTLHFKFTCIYIFSFLFLVSNLNNSSLIQLSQSFPQFF